MISVLSSDGFLGGAEVWSSDPVLVELSLRHHPLRDVWQRKELSKTTLRFVCRKDVRIECKLT